MFVTEAALAHKYINPAGLDEDIARLLGRLRGRRLSRRLADRSPGCFGGVLRIRGGKHQTGDR